MGSRGPDLPPVASHFPPYPQFQGFQKPTALEADVPNLEVYGAIPADIDGTFYRVMPDPVWSPFIENDPWFNGDGNISAFRIKSGRASFKQRYVRTEKFLREREAQRALLGKYRNKYTDAVEFQVRTTANTNVVYFNGKLLALKEDAPPYALDPDTLETIGLETFDGQLPGLTFTAHPKFDPVTNEMVCFGYEAKGDGTPDVCYYRVGADGQFLEEPVWLVSPVVAMIHDFAVTDNWVVFPLIPQVCDLERMKAGGEHWQWSPETPFYIGVLPRRGGRPEDVKWFRHPNCFPSHSSNAYEDESGNIVFDLGVSEKNVFFWWPDAKGNAPSPETLHSQLTRIIIDPRSEDLDIQPHQVKVLERNNSEFYRVDDRFATKKYRHSFFDMMDPSLGTNFPAIGPVLGGGYPLYNSLGHFDVETGETEVYFPGPTHMCQEPVFIPRTGSEVEGDGYLLALVNNYATMSSELHLVGVKDFTKCLAKILLPVRIRHGLHGNWVDAADVGKRFDTWHGPV